VRGTPAQVDSSRFQEIYRVRLDRGDLLLESIIAAIKDHDIQDGLMLTGVGSVQNCT
jgi:predicted DNA-binding protein with PD1-like motif